MISLQKGLEIGRPGCGLKSKQEIEDKKGIIQLRRPSEAFGIVLKSLMILLGQDGSRRDISDRENIWNF